MDTEDNDMARGLGWARLNSLLKRALTWTGVQTFGSAPVTPTVKCTNLTDGQIPVNTSTNGLVNSPFSVNSTYHFSELFDVGYTDGALSYQAAVVGSTGSDALNAGGGIAFGQNITGVATIIALSGIAGGKDTAAADYASNLRFFTRAAGAPIIQQAKIDSAGNLMLTNATITAGSDTGLTVNTPGAVNRQVHKLTITYAALAAAALTADKIIATLPAKTKLVGIYSDTTIPYTGGTVATATLAIGKTIGGVEYMAVHDVKTAAVVKGLLDADLGTAMVRAAAVQGGDLPSWTGTTNVSVRMTTTVDNTNALTAGSTTIYLVTERF